MPSISPNIAVIAIHLNKLISFPLDVVVRAYKKTFGLSLKETHLIRPKVRH
jgi:hypothetical protein